MTEATANAWIVRRHGGAGDDRWRTVYDGDDEETARATFRKIEVAMRQGGVELHHGDRLLRRTVAPRLRTRW
jgi:hypothetical protein